MRCWSGASSRRSCVAVSLAGKKRIDHQQLDLEFASTKKELDALQRELQGQLEAPSDETSDDGNKPSSPKPKQKPAGKRDLASCTSMPTQSIVIADLEGEALVLAGKASRMEAPPSYRLGYVRGGAALHVSLSGKCVWPSR